MRLFSMLFSAKFYSSSVRSGVANLRMGLTGALHPVPALTGAVCPVDRHLPGCRPIHCQSRSRARLTLPLAGDL